MEKICIKGEYKHIAVYANGKQCDFESHEDGSDSLCRCQKEE